VWVVAVVPRETYLRAYLSRLVRSWRKVRRLGLVSSLEIVSSYPLQRFFGSEDDKASQRLLQQLPRPAVPLDLHRVVQVTSVNDADAIEAMEALKPDLIIQAGAGILRARLFTTARLGAVNLHHGIAPLIRGMDSIYWALWANRPDWLGATVHWIDDGIDTGAVLAYAPIAPRLTGEGYPALYARATQHGADQLVRTLVRLEAGEKWSVAPPALTGVYRSTISGWRLLTLRIRSALQRIRANVRHGRAREE